MSSSLAKMLSFLESTCSLRLHCASFLKFENAEIVLMLVGLLQAVCNLYEARGVFLWLPTGFGKLIL